MQDQKVTLKIWVSRDRDTFGHAMELVKRAVAQSQRSAIPGQDEAFMRVGCERCGGLFWTKRYRAECDSCSPSPVPDLQLFDV